MKSTNRPGEKLLDETIERTAQMLIKNGGNRGLPRLSRNDIAREGNISLSTVDRNIAKLYPKRKGGAMRFTLAGASNIIVGEIDRDLSSNEQARSGFKNLESVISVAETLLVSTKDGDMLKELNSIRAKAVRAINLMAEGKPQKQAYEEAGLTSDVFEKLNLPGE